jgi:hypothetical protein
MDEPFLRLDRRRRPRGGLWRTDEETPVLVSIVEINESPPHAVTLQVKDTGEGEPG